MKIFIKGAILAFSIFLAERILPGVEAKNKGWYVYVLMAFVLAILNLILKPLLKFISCPLLILTLGLFSLIINAIIFYLTSYISNKIFGIEFFIRSFLDCILAALLVSIFNMVLSFIYKESKD